MKIRYNWELNKDTYDLSEFKKVIRKEIRKALKPIRDYVKNNSIAIKSNSKEVIKELNKVYIKDMSVNERVNKN